MLTRIDTTASSSQQLTQQQLKDQTATFSAQEEYISTVVYVIGSKIGNYNYVLSIILILK